MPQRGTNEWANRGYTNSRHVQHSKGKHTLRLSYEPYNENMDGEINTALIDFVRIAPLQP